MNVAILTNFQEVNPGYSLTGIVLDQVAMLRKNGHEVHLLVSEQYNTKFDHLLYDRIDQDDPQFVIAKVVPFGHLKDYSSMINWTPEHQYLSVQTGNRIAEYFGDNSIDVAFTHDWIFTGWNLPYAGGVRFASVKQPKVAWLHWVHSVPSASRDWWRLGNYGKQHRIIFPNITERRRVAEQFHTPENNVVVIPHIKDPRTWFNMGDDTKQFIDDHEALMTAEFVQVYPASSDRLSAKGIPQLIQIFASFKKVMKQDVCLVIANQWATGKARKEDVEKFYKIAEKAGLRRDKEFIFTSEYKGGNYDTGIPSKMLRELTQLSSIFIFPTAEESFGLVGPEAVLSGVFPVFNNSLMMMREIFGNKGLYFDFGSFHNNFEPQQGWDKYLQAVAYVIYNQYIQDPSVTAKSHCRRMYNSDVLYRNRYMPTIQALLQVSRAMSINPADLREVEEAMEKYKESFEEKQRQKKAEKKANNVTPIRKEDTKNGK